VLQCWCKLPFFLPCWFSHCIFPPQGSQVASTSMGLGVHLLHWCLLWTSSFSRPNQNQPPW